MPGESLEPIFESARHDYQLSVIKIYEDLIENGLRLGVIHGGNYQPGGLRRMDFVIKEVAGHDVETEKLRIEKQFALRLSASRLDKDGYRQCRIGLYEDKNDLDQEPVAQLAFSYQPATRDIRAYEDFTPAELMFDWKDILDSTYHNILNTPGKPKPKAEDRPRETTGFSPKPRGSNFAAEMAEEAKMLDHLEKTITRILRLEHSRRILPRQSDEALGNQMELDYRTAALSGINSREAHDYKIYLGIYTESPEHSVLRVQVDEVNPDKSSTQKLGDLSMLFQAGKPLSIIENIQGMGLETLDHFLSCYWEDAQAER